MRYKWEEAEALLKQGLSKREIAARLGYDNIQSVHNLLYQANIRRQVKPSDYKTRNVERVRQYLEDHPNCRWKEIVIDLKLAGKTVNRALRLLGGRSDTGRGGNCSNRGTGFRKGGRPPIPDPGDQRL